MKTKKAKYVRRLSTRLTRRELAQFRVVKKYVVSLCGRVSDAGVLRYLVRDWEKR